MGSSCYAATREPDGTYHLHCTAPDPRVIAKIATVRDRANAVLGWRLKPLVAMQGAASRVWPSPADAIAATKLLTPGKAKAAIRAAGTGDQV